MVKYECNASVGGGGWGINELGARAWYGVNTGDGECEEVFFFFFNDTATTEIYTLSLHDALPISYQFSLRQRPRFFTAHFSLRQRPGF